MAFVASSSRTVGGEEARHAVMIVELTDVGCTNQDVVVGVVGVNAEMAARPLAPCSRHNLHQSHGAIFRSSSLFATAFDAHDGAYPCCGTLKRLDASMTNVAKGWTVKSFGRRVVDEPCLAYAVRPNSIDAARIATMCITRPERSQACHRARGRQW
jgi:hypothetical protein